MKITERMINWLEFPREVVKLVLAPYLEMPRGEFPYVMQHHWRMRSVHVDWRMASNKHLVGFSVAHDSPVIIRRDALVEIVPIETVSKFRGKGLEILPLEGLEVYGRNGFVKATGIARHLFQHDLVEVTTRRGHIQVTPGHSLFKGGRPCLAKELRVGEEIDLGELSCNQEIFETPKDLAWLLGIFCARGYARFLKQWNCFLAARQKEILLKAQEILDNYGVPNTLDRPSSYWRLSFSSLGPYLERIAYVNSTNTSTHRRYKIIPKVILNSKSEAKRAFLEGYFSGNRSSLKISREPALTQGILYLASCLGITEFTYGKVNSRKIGWRHTASLSKKNRILKKPNEILRISLLNRGRNNYVYDFETEDNTFLAGVGKILAHNTILDNPKGTPKVTNMEEAERAEETVPFLFQAKNKNIGKRAETKSSQPVDWLEVQGVVKPGEVGATEHGPGVFYIFSKGKVIFGVQKPYFHEYFIKATQGKVFPVDTWTRITVTKVGVFKLDPITKRPLKKREIMWRVLIPGDQMPYAISDRAMEKRYRPPRENPTPFPEEWTRESFPEQYQKWLEWMKGKAEEEKICRNCYRFEKCTRPETLANPDRPACEKYIHRDLLGEEEEKEEKEILEDLSPAKFTLHYNSWMGQVVIRGIPKREWYLRIDDKGKGPIRSWLFEIDPLYYEPTSPEYEGRVDRKWLSFQGEIPPLSEYNPNRKIPSHMKIVDQGPVELRSETKEDVEIISLSFRGKRLRGEWRLVQQEKGSSIYTFERLSKLSPLEFVLQKHWIPLTPSPEWPKDFASHFDIRLSNGLEFNLYSNPLEAEVEERIRVRRKECGEVEAWMKITEDHTFMRVGPLGTYVDPIDRGEAEIYELSPHFISMKFFGERLKGYWVYRIEPTGEPFLIKSKLPEAEELKKGDPSTGEYYIPFLMEHKKGWDYYWLHLYSPGGFTRCVEDWKEYLPDLKKPPEILDILVCLYRRPGKIHGARVEGVKVSNEWCEEEATDWIKKNKLHLWTGELIRHKRETSPDEKLERTVERVLENIEVKTASKLESQEERELDLELKRTKLAFLQKWLEAAREGEAK